MGQKRSREIYVDGYGKEYYVDEMETSHIMHTMARLQERIDRISRLMDSGNAEVSRNNLEKAVRCVRNDIAMLSKEYAKRENAEECC